MMRYLIKGGTVVNHDYQKLADVLIEDRYIKEVGLNLDTPDNATVIDATGKFVIPGGIDTHTHMLLTAFNTYACDDFYVGTKAALCGGTTTIIDFVAPKRGKSLLDAYNFYRTLADSNVCCDYALHVIVPHFDDTVAKEMEELVQNHGVNSFKVFMAYEDVFMLNDDEIYEVFKKCKELKALPMVHAENGKLVTKKCQEVFDKGITGPEGHLYSRPEELEAEATNRAITIASQANSPLYVVHVMCKPAAKCISNAKREGKVIFGEALAAGIGCSGKNYFDKCWKHAAGHVMSPPIRLDADTGDCLLKLLSNGDMECTGTDHCVFKTEQKALGKDDFRKIPSGVNGVEERLAVIWEKGVRTGLLSVQQFVAITSANAAKVFNLYPRKGRIEAGCDADVVVWNGETLPYNISAETHHSSVDFNIFEGFTCHAKADVVFSAGKLVVSGDEVNSVAGDGSFIDTPADCKYVYERLDVKETLARDEMLEIKREAYTGPVAEPVDELPKEFYCRKIEEQNGGTVETKKPFANMQKSSFSLSGQQEGDTLPWRTGVRMHQPPGGASTSLW